MVTMSWVVDAERQIIGPPTGPELRHVSADRNAGEHIMPVTTEQRRRDEASIRAAFKISTRRLDREEHRLDHRVLRTQLHHARDQLYMSRTRKICSAQPDSARQNPARFKGRSCTKRDHPGKSPDQAAMLKAAESPDERRPDVAACGSSPA
jgi:hypothetical protein